LHATVFQKIEFFSAITFLLFDDSQADMFLKIVFAEIIIFCIVDGGGNNPSFFFFVKINSLTVGRSKVILAVYLYHK